MIDFSKNAITVPNNYLGADKKRTVIYNGEKYLLKFSTYKDVPKNNELATSYSNNVFSEYIGCKFFKSCGIDVQEVILGQYTDINRNGEKKVYPVVACKDFTTEDFELYEFKALENSYLDGTSGGKTPTLEDVNAIMESEEGIFALISEKEAKNRYWDVFIVDALLGNFDRHAGNWGYLYDMKHNIAKLAPVYDCGSCLFPRASDEAYKNFLESETEMELRVSGLPNAALLVNGKKINYFDYITSMNNEECNAALKRMFKRIDIEELHKIIDTTPMISEVRKQFYREITKRRYNKIIKQTYDRLIEK